ncbi:hypothetical protein IU485_28040 [Nocardia cyriacigeorgica]|uniref:hypothetical protein n=1 Tax=Nocardia cyriacigeorgica TaxID=135487 RepID=UPI0018931AC9|nr:hypothetical protein [Nocardia cyriacigeorgica]MBF6085224.1 hypothetical protein [Nocardia cyriacigeorgica]
MPKSVKSAAKKSRFAQLKAEAKQNYEPLEPYEFDAVDPPVYITEPDSLERSLALATLLDSRGSVAVKDLKPMIEALVGDVFPIVWAHIRDEPIEVALALVKDINAHFDGIAPDESAEDVPGGEPDSSR